MDDPTIVTDGGTSQEGINVRPNLEEDMKAAGIEDVEEDTTEDLPDDSDENTEEGEEVDVEEDTETEPEEDLSDKRTAISEAIKNRKQAKQERAEKEFYKTAHEVYKDPNSILNLHDEDPEMADRVAKENWGVSYDKLIEMSQEQTEEVEKKTAPSVDPTLYSEEMIEKIVERKLQQKQQMSEKEKVDKLTVDFFLENDVDLKGPTFKSIMSEFDEMKPKKLAHAEKLLRMLYEEHTGRSSVAVGNIESVSMPKQSTRSARKSTKAKQTHRDIAKTARSLGFDISAEDVKKYS